MKTIMLLPSLALGLAAGAAQAQVFNGNFAAGTTGWNPLGDIIAQAGTLSLTTAYNADDDAPYNLSGTPAASIDAVESASGLAPYALDFADPIEPAYEGSVARQSFMVAAGDTLSFQWSFSTRENLFLDRAYTVVAGDLVTLATRGSAPTGLQTFSRSFAAGGMVTLVFGVVDTGDFNGVSTLNISNVQLQPVPEPASWLLMLGGVGALAQWQRRRRQQR